MGLSLKNVILLALIPFDFGNREWNDYGYVALF